MNRDLVNNYILHINKMGSLSRAARALNISQPALSMGLTQLEKELGFIIFDRKCSPIALTKAGELYVDYLVKKEALEEDYLHRIEDLEGSAGNHIRTGAPNIYVNSLLTAAVAKLYMDNPDFSITIENATVPELMEMTEKAKIDCFISTSRSNEDEFEDIFIKVDDTYLCVPSGNELNEGLHTEELDDLSVLNGQNMIFLKPDQPMQISTDKLIKREKLRVNNSLKVNQISTALSLVDHGAGICFASGEAVRSYEKNRNFNIYLVRDSLFDRNIYVTYYKTRYLSKACRKMITLLGGTIKNET